MASTELESRIIQRGKAFFSSISGEKPSLFNKGAWTGKVMDWSMQNEQFKIQPIKSSCLSQRHQVSKKSSILLKTGNSPLW